MVIIHAETTGDNFPKWIQMVSKNQRLGSVAGGYLCCLVCCVLVKMKV